VKSEFQCKNQSLPLMPIFINISDISHTTTPGSQFKEEKNPTEEAT